MKYNKPKKRINSVAVKKNEGRTFSYKRPSELRSFITSFGTILPRTDTNLSLSQQKQLAREIKRARHLAFLPFTQTV